MTQKEKIILLKDTIKFLYEKEGRSKSYISKLLNVDRKTLSNTMNYDWKLTQANVRYMRPSNKKFLNKHQALIKSRLDRDVSIADICKELNVSRDFLVRTIINQSDVLKTSLSHYHARIKTNTEKNLIEQKNKSSYEYNIKDMDGEEWCDILGYDGYMISNKGRIKSYVKTYDDYRLLTTLPNPNNGRIYVWIQGKGLQVARLVGFSFVNGYSEINNTINHIDRDVQNNYSSNLEWVSQSENNQHAYDTGRQVVIAHQKYGKFKKIILNNKYEFKTIRAMAKFIGKSETQVRRYIDNETENEHTFEFIY